MIVLCTKIFPCNDTDTFCAYQMKRDNQRGSLALEVALDLRYILWLTAQGSVPTYSSQAHMITEPASFDTKRHHPARSYIDQTRLIYEKVLIFVSIGGTYVVPL